MDSDGDDDEDGMDSHGDDEDSGGFLPLQDVLGGVQSLEIYDATLGDLSVLFLAKCLRFNTVLRSVNLGYNNIGAQGASALAAVLKEMKISELNVDGHALQIDELKGTKPTRRSTFRSRVSATRLPSSSRAVSRRMACSRSSIYSTTTSTRTQRRRS